MDAAHEIEQIKHLKTARCPFVNLPEKAEGRWGQGLTAEKMKACIWLKPEAVVRIGELFAIERDIKGAPPGERRRVRQELALPKLQALRPWFETQLGGLASDSNLAKACRYPLNRWAAMIRYCDDGLLEISNNLVENALRGVALLMLDLETRDRALRLVVELVVGVVHVGEARIAAARRHLG